MARDLIKKDGIQIIELELKHEIDSRLHYYQCDEEKINISITKQSE